MTEPPAVGSYIVDTRSDRIGIVKAVLAGRLYLRPPGGEKEWEAMPAHVRLATPREALPHKVAEANEHRVRRLRSVVLRG